MSKVVILTINEYEKAYLVHYIKEAIVQHFAHEHLFEGRNILLKPNLLMNAAPQDAIVTHPVFVEAVGSLFKEEGCPVYIADAPGGFMGRKAVEEIYEGTGLKAIAQRNGFTLLYPTHSFVKEELPLCWWVDPVTSLTAIDEGAKAPNIPQEPDSLAMINLPKLKTHEIMVLTLATKNLYGCISGLHKSYLHRRYPTTEGLSEVILKLYRNIHPALHIVDGILALEGEGPAKKGKPRKLDMVVLGDDALAVDYVIGSLLGLCDEAHPLIRTAQEKGFLDTSRIEVISDYKRDILDFKFPSPYVLNRFPKGALGLLDWFLRFRPCIQKESCTGCCACRDVCPTGAIYMEKEKAVIDYKKCIMCMCCGEVCRFGAVDLEKNVFLKALDLLHRWRIM